MKYQFFIDTIKHTGELVANNSGNLVPEFVTEAGFILQGQFVHDGQKSVEVRALTGFNPAIHLDDLVTSGESIGFDIAKSNCWYSKLEDHQASILATPVKYRPDGQASRNLTKVVDTEAKLVTLQSSVPSGENPSVEKTNRRNAEISGMIAERPR
jgi:hypothetical protein